MATDDRGRAKVERSRTSELTHERFKAAMDADLTGCPMYPDGASFVAADIDGIGKILLRNARENTPTVIVYEDGEERLLIPSPRLDSRWTARLRGRVLRAIWAIKRPFRRLGRRRPAGPRTAAP